MAGVGRFRPERSVSIQERSWRAHPPPRLCPGRTRTREAEDGVIDVDLLLEPGDVMPPAELVTRITKEPGRTESEVFVQGFACRVGHSYATVNIAIVLEL